jgi:hypothetical protein
MCGAIPPLPNTSSWLGAPLKSTGTTLHMNIQQSIKKVMLSESCNAVSLKWCERWNININAVKTQAIYFSHHRRPVEAHLTLKGRSIPFVNIGKYPGVIFDRKISWRIHIEIIAAKALSNICQNLRPFKKMSA